MQANTNASKYKCKQIQMQANTNTSKYKYHYKDMNKKAIQIKVLTRNQEVDTEIYKEMQNDLFRLQDLKTLNTIQIRVKS